MAYYNVPVGRKKLHTWEKIAIVLGCADALTFDDERCRGIGGWRQLPIRHLEKARDELAPTIQKLVIALQCAAEWANDGRGDKDKAVRGTIIVPPFLLMNDGKLAERYARRRKIAPGTKKTITEGIAKRAILRLRRKEARRRWALEHWEVDAEEARVDSEAQKRLRQRFRQRINFLRRDLWRVIGARLKNDAFY
jgi:hypothetical protein